jgi:hypothetical protein
MGELTRGERLQIMLSPTELAALDDWRFAKRMPSRASAVREILKRGLAAEGFATAKNGSRSKDYAVVDGAKAGSKKPARSATDTSGLREAPQRLARASRHRGDVSI